MKGLIDWGNAAWEACKGDPKWMPYINELLSLQLQVNSHYLRLRMEKGNIDEWQMGIALFAAHDYFQGWSSTNSYFCINPATTEDWKENLQEFYFQWLGQRSLWKEFFTIWMLIESTLGMVAPDDLHESLVEQCIARMVTA